MVTIPVISVPHVVKVYRHVVFLLMFKILSIKKYSWKHKTKQLNDKTEGRTLKLHTKNGIRKHMVKIFIYSNAEISL